MSGVLYAVVGELIGAFAPELKASIGDGSRNLPNLGMVLSDAGEVIGDAGELYAGARSGDPFMVMFDGLANLKWQPTASVTNPRIR